MTEWIVGLDIYRNDEILKIILFVFFTLVPKIMSNFITVFDAFMY